MMIPNGLIPYEVKSIASEMAKKIAPLGLWLTTNIPTNLLGGLSTKATRLGWDENAIFILSMPH